MFSAEPHIRNKRHLENIDKKSNASETIDREEIRRLHLALSSLACNINCPKGIRGRRGRPGPRGSPGKHGPPGHKEHRDLKETKVLREFRDLLDLKATKDPKDPRAILANLCQPL